MLEREDQFLDLIAENAQLKEEIKSLQEYSTVVKLFDRDVLELCRSQILNDPIDSTVLDQKITFLRNGMRPVNSAAAWKNKLRQEILQKQSQSFRSTCDSLIDRRTKYQQKISILEKDIDAFQRRMDESKSKCTRADNEREKLKKQIDECQKYLDKSVSTLQETKNAVEAEQAASIKIKRTMEQTAKSLYSYSQTSAGVPYSAVADSIKDLQSYLDSSN